VLVVVHGAAVANMALLPHGAAVIEVCAWLVVRGDGTGTVSRCVYIYTSCILSFPSFVFLLDVAFFVCALCHFVAQLKQYGEYGTQPRDLAAASGLHHAAVRAPSPPRTANIGPRTAGERGREQTGWCPMVRPLGSPPASFCDTMSFHPVRCRPGHPFMGGTGVIGWGDWEGVLRAYAFFFSRLLTELQGAHDVTVDEEAFEEALADALAVTGLRPLACEGLKPGIACPTSLGWT